ncbi:protein tolkin-like [Amphiura filiformis]|uniref:protein tolkin-like n=1 Tax=Amphiura filiformis TaxID=82378 RepID=UPI003B21D4C4
MSLRRGSGSNQIACLDYLDIDDTFQDRTTERRGRYCGDWADIQISSRTNQVKVTLQIGELDVNMPDEIGFQMIYQTKDCSFDDCHSECKTGGSFTQTHGNISTPNYPSILLPFSRCSWTISLPTNSFIELNFEDFFIGDTRRNGECIEKVLVTMDIYSGNPVTWEYCGNIHPLVISSSSAMNLEFISQLESESLGFQAQYTASDTPGCQVGFTKCQNCKHACTLDHAIIASCNYPNTDEPNSDCIWVITTTKGTYVKMMFQDLDVPSQQDCRQNNVAIFDGRVDRNVLLGTFCNSKLPGNSYVRSSFNILTVTFRTYGDLNRGRGFIAEYIAATFQDKNDMSLNITSKLSHLPYRDKKTQVTR